MLAIATALALTATQANLVENGGFDNGLAGWSKSGNGLQVEAVDLGERDPAAKLVVPPAAPPMSFGYGTLAPE